MNDETREARARGITIDQLRARRAARSPRARLTPEERAAQDLAAEARARGITPAELLTRRDGRRGPPPSAGDLAAQL